MIQNNTNWIYKIEPVHFLIDDFMSSFFFGRPQLRSLDSGNFDKLRNSTTLHLQAKVTVFIMPNILLYQRIKQMCNLAL